MGVMNGTNYNIMTCLCLLALILHYFCCMDYEHDHWHYSGKYWAGHNSILFKLLF